MKPSEIKQLAENVKEYVEKNKKIPSKLTINKITYSWPQIWYILSYGVANLNKELKTVPAVVKCKEPTGDNIKEDIKPEDYKKQAKKIVDFINNKDNKNKCPNYVTTIVSKKKIRPRLSIYANARILVWYYNHKKLPDYCTFNSSYFKKTNSTSSAKTNTSTTSSKTKTTTNKSTIKKYGRSTKSGCDNRGQNTSVWCGPHMAQEIIRNLTGIVISQKKIAAIMGSTTSGTGHYGIDLFFVWFNKNYPHYTLKWEWKNFSDLGWNGIKKRLTSNNMDCGIHELYRDEYGHYTNFDKIYDNTIDVHNSLGSKCSGSCYCGYTENRTKATAKRYISGISQKSVLVVTRTK